MPGAYGHQRAPRPNPPLSMRTPNHGTPPLGS